MLELAADLRLLDEAVDQVGPVAVSVEQDLQRQVAAEVGVAAAVDGAHAAAGDLAEQAIAAGRAVDQALAAGRPLSARAPVRSSARTTRDRPRRDRPGRAARRPSAEHSAIVGIRLRPAEQPRLAANLGVVERRQAPSGRRAAGSRGQALRGAAAVLLEVAGDEGLDGGAVVGVEVAAGDQVLGQRPPLLERPGLKGRDELRLVDQAVLQGEQTEEEIAIGIDGGHDVVFPERPAGPAGDWTPTTVSLHRAMNRIGRIIAWPLV